MADRLYVELGTSELASALGVTQRTVQRRIKSGELTGHKDPRGRYVVPTPTRVAAKALGVSESTVRARAARGELRRFTGSERAAERAYTPRPPAELVQKASDPERFGHASTRAMRDWLSDTGPGWLNKLVDGGPALPLEGAVIMAGAGLPPPAEWGPQPGVEITPHDDGTARVVITTDRGTFDLGRIPAMVAWDMRRAFTALDVEIEVNDTP
jgi:excisionase family DNA binding protein